MEKRFKEICLERKESIAKYDNVILMIKDQLRIIPHYFVHFSRHDVSHSEKIIGYISQLIDIQLLSASDLLFILLASYCHDLGMSLSFNEIEDKFSEKDFSEVLKSSIDTSFDDLKQVAETILNEPEKDLGSGEKALSIYSSVTIAIENIYRTNHAERSAERIKERSEIRSLLGDRLINILASICSLHDKKIERIMELPQEENGLFSDYLHPRFIAASLQLGDLLDMDADRFDNTMVSAATRMPELSELHKKKHESITHFLVKNGYIEITANCGSIPIYRLMRQWVDWMKEVCQYMVLNWSEITPCPSLLPPRLKKCEIAINSSVRWAGYANTKLTVNGEKALQLLEGNNIYYGKSVFVREIIQNAIDASLIQLFLDAESIKHASDDASPVGFKDILDYLDSKKLSIDNYKIDGEFYLRKDGIDNGNVVFELSDNGTGICDSEIPMIVGLLGKSKKLKSIISRIPSFIKPSGAFGIGLQSVFLVASKIEMYTKAEDEPPKKITIEDPSSTGFVYVEDVEEPKHKGTRIIVSIDERKVSQTDLGVSDYDYQTRDKNELILNWLCNEYDNVRKYSIPVLERS